MFVPKARVDRTAGLSARRDVTATVDALEACALVTKASQERDASGKNVLMTATTMGTAEMAFACARKDITEMIVACLLMRPCHTSASNTAPLIA